MTETLVNFLRARLDEREHAARNGRDLGELSGWVEVVNEDVRRAERHFRYWEPAAVLADVEAKRQIVNIYQWHLDYIDRSSVETIQRVERIAKLLALPYADHPDYRKGWRP